MKNLQPFAAAVLLALALPGLAQEEKKESPEDLGKAVFEEQCSVCHAADSDEKKVGPSLKGLFKKEAMKNGKKPTDDTVMKIINEGGNGMPGYDEVLEKNQKTQVLAFLKTL
jgi:mono/diheme cytochrome c family protein